MRRVLLSIALVFCFAATSLGANARVGQVFSANAPAKVVKAPSGAMVNGRAITWRPTDTQIGQHFFEFADGSKLFVTVTR